MSAVLEAGTIARVGRLPHARALVRSPAEHHEAARLSVVPSYSALEMLDTVVPPLLIKR